MKQVEGMDAYTDAYERLRHEPVIIRAHLAQGSPIVAYDPIYLDNLLARCVVDQVTHGRGLPGREDWWLPVPVKMLWAAGDGRPLWAASVFEPIGQAEGDTIYSHKRAPKSVYSETKGIKNNTGRWMDRRTPLPAVVCVTWEARCWGNIEEIQRLLAGISFLGKRRTNGFGEVQDWEVIPGDFPAQETILRDGTLCHAVPVEYAQAAGWEFGTSPMLVGWTPPQWKAELHSMGWPIGTAMVRA